MSFLGKVSVNMVYGVKVIFQNIVVRVALHVGWSSNKSYERGVRPKMGDRAKNSEIANLAGARRTNEVRTFVSGEAID